MGTRIPCRGGWLDLVAETAGVARCGIVRVQLLRRGIPHSPNLRERIVVQVRSGEGTVLGATLWRGFSDDLFRGTGLDVGYCLPEPTGLDGNGPSSTSFGMETDFEADSSGILEVVAWPYVRGDPGNPFTSRPGASARTARVCGRIAATLCLDDATSVERLAG